MGILRLNKAFKVSASKDWEPKIVAPPPVGGVCLVCYNHFVRNK